MLARRTRKGLVALVLCLTLVMPNIAVAAPVRPTITRGEAAIDALGTRLPDVARSHGTSTAEFKRTLRRENRLAVDRKGRLLYTDEAPSAAEIADVTGNPTLNLSGVTASQIFTLNSRPGSSRTLYLDFDGHVLTGTAWNVNYGVSTIDAPAFNADGVAGFSADELARIKEMWARVAEDYAPFDVNVTTQYPGEAALTRTDSSDLVFGNRVLVSAISQYFGRWGGVSYVGVFGRASDYGKPSLVFPENLGHHPKYVGEAISHEAGHSLGLNHDGITGTEYYSGHGAGATSWAPIMGNSYSRTVTQWSRGEYPGATNTQDDVQIIAANGAPMLADDRADTDAGALPVTGTTQLIGRIGRPGDIDVIRVDAGAGRLLSSVSLASLGSNLDASIEVADSTGRIIASSNPVDSLVASVDVLVAGGTYYVRLRGVGKGDLATGYSNYGSLGIYSLSLSAAQPQVVPVANIAPTAVANVSAASGTAPLPVTFDGSGSSDVDGQVVSWTWATGDGTALTSAVAQHTYSNPGTYTATLTVTDDQGATSSASRTVVVTAPVVVVNPQTVARIESIALMPLKDIYGNRVRGSVRVVDRNAAPVSGAYIDAKWSGKTSGAASGYTDANGILTLTSRYFKGTGSVTLTVRNVTKPGWTFDAASGPTSSSLVATAQQAAAAPAPTRLSVR